MGAARFYRRVLVGGAVVALLVIGSTRLARAQSPWVGNPHSLTADFAYQYLPASATIINSDIKVEDRTEQNHITTISAEYVPIDKLAVEIGLPIAMLKYTGDAPHDPPGVWDDGKFHTTLTDLKFGARYQVLDEPYIAISPFVTFSIPVMDYEVIGFTTGGRHLKQAHVGAGIGRTFDPFLPNLYFTASYEFTLSEKFDANAETKKIGQNRSDVDFQLGYVFLDGRLGISAGVNWRKAHGGINFVDFGMLSPDLTMLHDPILAEEFIFVGGGASFVINPKLTVTAATRFFITGKNTHDQQLYGLSLSWNIL